jgi:6-pyruvoyl-tetrahydropterin synthase
MHGHTYVVELGLTADLAPDTDMVVDLKEMSEWLKCSVVALFDHRCLNDYFEPAGKRSTAENIAADILKYAKIEWPAKEITVRLFETRDSWVEVHG